MREQVITFEAAKLAKEKGFDIPSSSGLGISTYDEKGQSSPSCWVDSETILAPTQSLLQKWLREEHDLDVLLHIQRDSNPLTYGFSIYITGEQVDIPCAFYWKYEEGLEEGLQEALKLIK